MRAAPREVIIRATSAQRQVLAAYLNTGHELEVVATGGSRFGGKTWVGAHCLGYRRLQYRGTRGLALRTVQRAADLNMGEELKQAFFFSHGLPVGSRNRGEIQHLVGDNRFVFPNGSMIQLGFCRTPNDWQQHLGLQWDDIWFEQAEQFPERVYTRLRGSNRPNNPDCIPKSLLTFNPGGIGSEWLERRIVNDKTRDRRVLWVPSLVRECVATLERDPSYVMRSLMSITDPILRAQWLHGDWDAQSGIYFRLCPGYTHRPATIRSEPVPYWADWYGGVDWGGSRPFAYVIVAHWEDGDGKRHIHVAGEVYQTDLDLDQQAELALAKEKELKQSGGYPYMHAVDIRMADPMTADAIEKTTAEQTRSKASVWAEHGFLTYPSFKYSRTSGWALMKYLIRHDILSIDPACMALIKEIRSAVRQEYGEDIDQKRSADHALDALRYILCYLFGIDYAEEPEEDRRWDLKAVKT